MPRYKRPCPVEGCRHPVFSTADNLCLVHLLQRPAVPDAPAAPAEVAPDPVSPQSDSARPRRRNTPKE